MTSVWNFNAGPAQLPSDVLLDVQRNLIDYRGWGISVMEMSHRSKAYEEIHHTTRERVRTLLGVGDDYAILFLQGGASLQFSMVPMNLATRSSGGDYVMTGVWSKKALEEAKKVGRPRVAASSENDGFLKLPDDFDFDPSADYVHLTSNNTIYGTQWHSYPETGSVPVVCDMSSDIFSRPIRAEGFSLIYAGAQKNLGPAGVTLVAAHKSLLERSPDDLPSLMNYRTLAASDSLYNTPPCFAIYVVGLVCGWILEQGGLEEMDRLNRDKASLLYRTIDESSIFEGIVDSSARSLMNVTFRLPSAGLETQFLSDASKEGFMGLKGHKSASGLRASLYNAMPLEGVSALAEFMREFERRSR